MVLTKKCVYHDRTQEGAAMEISDLVVYFWVVPVLVYLILPLVILCVWRLWPFTPLSLNLPIISLMNSNRKNRSYISYLQDHPECLKDEPPHVSSTLFWRMPLDEGRCTGEEMARSVAEARHHWEQYHLEKAKTLGFDISIRQLHLDKNWILGIRHQGNDKSNLKRV